MSKKMCPRYKDCDHDWSPKPIHTYCESCNSSCELIPKKPKTRKIKAWAFVKTEYTWGGKPVLCGAKMFKDHQYNTPCTITIAEKYLKGRK